MIQEKGKLNFLKTLNAFLSFLSLPARARRRQETAAWGRTHGLRDPPVPKQIFMGRTDAEAPILGPPDAKR